jgi:TPR repeat protein
LFYDKGRYVSAKKWFQKGVAQNHPRSNYYLGRMYLVGLGVRKDVIKARSFLRKAVSLHAPRAKRLFQSNKLKQELALQKLTNKV